MSAPGRSRPLLAIGAAIVAGVLLILLFTGGSDGDHRLWVTADDATGMLDGQDVRLAGAVVGKVASVAAADKGRAARVELSLTDEGWPLPRGTRFQLRWGGTVAFVKRYVAVQPGHARGVSYREGDTIPASDFAVPVEFDSLMAEFTPPVRRDLSAFLTRGGATLREAQPELRDTVRAAPPAVRGAGSIMSTLDENRARLGGLVRSTGRVVDAVRSADPSVEQAVVGAGRTLEATARSAAGLQGTLRRAPATFTRVRGTLARADRTLDLAADVTRKLSPGVTELQRTVAPLNRLLETVVDVGPTARSTLATARTSAPDVTAFLSRANRMLPDIQSTLEQTNTQLDCIRPYTPEIVALTSNWAGFISSTDGRDHYARILPSALPWAPTNVQAETSGEAFKSFPGMRMGMPRAPGSNADQPWYQPQCEVTAEGADPFKDPEARPGQQFSMPPLVTEQRGRGGR